MHEALLVVVGLSLVFAYVNGMHDAAAAVATSVATRALTPGIAVAMASGFNLVGGLLGVGVAQTIRGQIVTPQHGLPGLAMLAGALVGATAWSLLTWWRGVPSSSSHALVGGLAGAGVAAGVDVGWEAIIALVVLPMLVVPTVALLASAALTTAIMWGWRNSSPGRSYRLFEQCQTVSAAALALGHGLQDAQKTMGVVVLALVAAGEHSSSSIPVWVRVVAALALAVGTTAGGWRIVRTLGRRLIDLDSPRGFAAEAVSATLLYVAAYGVGAPISTTHTVTGAVVGSGVVSRFSAVRWRVVRDVCVAWVLTPVASAVMAAAVVLLLGVLR